MGNYFVIVESLIASAFLCAATLACLTASSVMTQGRAGSASSPPGFGFPSYSERHGLKVYQVGGSIKSPEPISCPDILRKVPSEPAGTVIIAAVIDARGRVRFPKVVQGLGSNEKKLAVAQVQKWNFKPARKGKQDVAVQTELNVRFQ